MKKQFKHNLLELRFFPFIRFSIGICYPRKYASLAQSVEHLTVNQVVVGSSPSRSAKKQVLGLAFLFSALFAGVSQRLVCFANCRRFSPVTVVSRTMSARNTRLVLLALWVTPFAETILNRFACTNPSRSAKKQVLRLAFLFFALFVGVSQRLVCFANCRWFSPVTVVSRNMSARNTRLVLLALWVTPFAETILNRFVCTNPSRSAKKQV